LQTFFVPNFFAAGNLGLSDKLYFGVGSTSNWGLSTEWADDSFSRYAATKTELENVDVVDATGQTFGYISLAGIGIPPVGAVADDELLNFTIPSAVQYGGVGYDRIGMVSNGYLVMAMALLICFVMASNADDSWPLFSAS